MCAKAVDVHAHFSTREGFLSMMKFSKGLASYYMKAEVTAEHTSQVTAGELQHLALDLGAELDHVPHGLGLLVVADVGHVVVRDASRAEEVDHTGASRIVRGALHWPACRPNRS